MAIEFQVRVRDLVHSFVHLTALEKRVVDHSLFQRLRQVRQNDVGHYVYPSLNTTRFEHSLGCAEVAGKMATNLTRSADWPEYREASRLEDDVFVQISRMYALLHDIGHLPMSYLFETAFENYVSTKFPDDSVVAVATRWFGGKGFSKPHESWGGLVADKILADVAAPEEIRGPVLRLLSTKVLPRDDVHRPLKLIVDSDIDADRVDATARDGLAAGGEYGNHDIERLCAAVFLQKKDGSWRLAYSHKAMSSIEALLLDRYRAYTHIHFHHRLAALRVAASELVSELLIGGEITPADFDLTNPEQVALRDDPWLWMELREIDAASPSLQAARRALLYRDKNAMTLLWKNRAQYQGMKARLEQVAGVHEIPKLRLGRPYQKYISEKLEIPTRTFWLPFEPVSNQHVPLTDEGGSTDVGELRTQSRIVSSLHNVWSGEPQWYLVFLGKPSGETRAIEKKWIRETAAWISDSA